MVPSGFPAGTLGDSNVLLDVFTDDRGGSSGRRPSSPTHWISPRGDERRSPLLPALELISP
jgi:hypothetical protein